MEPDGGGMILLDIAPGVAEGFERSFLERSGHPVVACHGPEHGHLCPILAGAGCDRVDGAHGIVFALDLDRTQHRAILRRYLAVVRDDLPVRVVVRPGQRERYADVLAGVEVWEGDPNAAALDGFAAEVEAADRFR
jgi:hypothetical protein